MSKNKDIIVDGNDFIPIRLLLWGCERWVLAKKLKKLEVLHLRCVRSILKIKWIDVMNEIITNKHILERFDIKFLSNYTIRRD